MKWQTIIEGIIVGVSAAVIISLAVLLRDGVRNIILEQKIRRCFKRLSHGSGIHGAFIGVSNRCGRPFTVRSVAIETSNRTLNLNPFDEVKPAVIDKPKKLTRRERKVVDKGGKVLVSESLSFGKPWKVEQNPSGFVEIDPYTERKWFLPLEITPEPNVELLCLRVQVEFRFITGGVKILNIQSSRDVETLQQVVSSLYEQLESGSLNRAREALNLPAVKPLPRKKKPKLGGVC